MLVFFVIALIGGLTLTYTTYGRRIYAVGTNPRAAFLAGIDVKTMRLSVYAIQGLLVGIGATMLLARINTGIITLGQGLEIDTIAMVVIGGTALSGGKGNIVGTLIGVLFLGSIANAMNMLRLPSEVQFLAKGLVVIIAVVGWGRLVADLRVPRLEARAGERTHRGGGKKGRCTRSSKRTGRYAGLIRLTDPNDERNNNDKIGRVTDEEIRSSHSLFPRSHSAHWPLRPAVMAADAHKKVIGYYMDASDDFYKAGFEVFKTLAEREGWTVLDVVGQGTAPEQIAAVENFITQGVDALLVVQNSPETTSKTLELAKAAGIPEFHLTHNPPNEPGLAGFAGYDWVGIGELAGQSAIQHHVKRVIMIEGKLGQGTAAGQTGGFLKAYKERRQGHRQPRRQRRRQGRRRQGSSGRVLGFGRMVRRSRQEGHAGCDHQPRGRTASTAPMSKTTR